MKKWAFVSDFDGTLTSRDFYHIVIDKYLKERGRELYAERKRNGKIDVEFLNLIFGSVNLPLDDLVNDIYSIPFDPAAGGFIREVGENGGKFLIVSAGTSYYINIFLKHAGIDAEVISLHGEYNEGSIRILPDEKSPYYSRLFGLDKRKVIEDTKKEYDVVFFAGDSEPDLAAAKAADFVFAKDELARMLDAEKVPYINYASYFDIRNRMLSEGWIR